MKAKQYMKRKLLYILVLLFTVMQGAWAQSTAYVSTYAELSAAVENASVDNIIVTANIDVPCETSVTNTSNPDLTGASTAQLVIKRSLTLQSQAGYKFTIKRIAANEATTDHLKSLISIRGNGNGTSGTANLTGNTVEVTFTNIIIDGGANWGSSTVSDRRTAATTAYGNAGRSMIDVFMGGTLNLEDGVVLQNGFTTYSINSVVNDSGSYNYGGAVRVEYDANYGGGTVNLKAGATIHDCSAQGASNIAGYGGALGAYNFARLNVYGGTIYNCSAASGGAIGCTWRNNSDHATSGTINLFGGTIRDCYANKGGAILTEGKVEDYLLGGTISNCTATTEGGAIAIPEKDTQVHIVDHSSGWLTISNCSPYVAGSASTGYYPCVSMHEEATISTTPVYQVTFRNNNTDFAVLHVLQGNSLGEAFPAAPVNAGLRFLGWYNGDTQITSSTAITDNTTVTAKWDFFGNGTSADPYQIPSVEAWDFLAGKVDDGETYSEKYFQLTNNISVTTKVGASTTNGNFKSFNGTFDGNRKTLNVTYSGSGQWTAAFGALSGATVKNLHITGSISTSTVRPASIAGFIIGNSTIENCWSEVAISSSQKNYWVDAGAFVARVNESKTLTLKGCLFTGSITYSDENAYEGGGMIGWAQNYTTVKFYDCVFAPSAISITKYQDQYIFAATYDGYATKTIDNCYYNNVANTPSMNKEGKLWHSITVGTGVTISSLGTASATYNVSGITAYTHGIKYGDTYYAGSGDAVSLTLSHGSKTGYTFSHYTVTGGGSLNAQTETSATLTMIDADQTINAEYTRNAVTLTDGEDVTALSPFAGKQCDVTYLRSFNSGKASTVCLPFAYTKKEGDGSFYAFTGITKEDGNYVATMTEPGTTTLTANTPYLYMPSTTGNVDFSGTYTIPSDLTAGTTTSGDWTFLGTYTTVEWPTAPTGTYGFSAQNVSEQSISQGQFVKVGAYVRVKPMRCYLKYKNGSENFAGARMIAPRRAAEDETLPETISVRLVNANGNVTTIGTLHTQTGAVTLDDGTWYTLDGTRLQGNPTHKGIYVNNGRKIVIK